MSLVEVVLVFIFRRLLSGVDAIDLLVLLNWRKFCFVRGRRWEEASDDAELGGFREVRIDQ